MKTHFIKLRIALMCISFLFLHSAKAQLVGKALVVPEFTKNTINTYFATTSGKILLDLAYKIDLKTMADDFKTGKPNVTAMFGDDLYVTIIDEVGNGKIYKFPNYKNNPAYAKANVLSIEPSASHPSASHHYVGLTFDAAGNLYVSKGVWDNTNIFKYPVKPDGKFDTPINLGNGGSASYFSNLTFDAAGNLWASDYKNNRVISIKAADLNTAIAPFHELNGDVLGNYTPANTVTGLTGNVNYVFRQPEGVAFDSNGVLWVANNNDRVNNNNAAPTLVALSVAYQNLILSAPAENPIIATLAMANQANGYKVLNLPSSASGRGQLGGIQIDKAINRIYINEQVNGSGLWFDLNTIDNITNVFSDHHLNIASTNPGNGGSALFDSTFVIDDSTSPPPALPVATPLAYKALVVPEFNNGVVKTYFSSPTGIIVKPSYTIDLKTLGNSLATTGNPNVANMFGDDLYVTIIVSGGNGRIYKFPNYRNKPADAIANVSKVTENANDYVGIAFDTAGNLYAAEGVGFNNNKIVIYTATNLATPIPVGKTTREPIDLGNFGKQSYFSNITFDVAGNLWASDYKNHRVICIKKANLNTGTIYHELINNSSGTITSANTIQPLKDISVAKLFSNPTGVDFDKNGVLWVANNNNDGNNAAPTLVALSVAYQNTILNASSPKVAEPNKANQIDGYNVYSLPSSGSGTGKLGGIQIDKFNNHIYMSDKDSNSGLVFDLGTIKDIENNFGKYELKIDIKGGNGGISLFSEPFKWRDYIFKEKIARGIQLPLNYIIRRAENKSSGIAESYMKLIDEVAKTGANTIRIPWYTQKHWNENLESPYKVTIETINEFVAEGHLSNVIAYAISKEITPILSIDDDAISCKDNVGDATTHFNDEVMKFWTSEPILKLIEANQSHLMINLASKFDQVYSQKDLASELEAFQVTYNNAIAKLRELGVTGPIMIDAPDCGRSSSELASIANAMIKADPNNALIFSADIDWTYDNRLENIQAKLDVIKKENIPFVLSGISSKQNNGCGELDLSTVYPQVLEETCGRQIGWMTSDFASDCSPEQQITTDGNFENLTTFGKDIVYNEIYGLKSTKGCGTTTPIILDQYTLIPDAAFEDKLIELGIDTDGVKGKVLTSSIDMITNLDLSYYNVSQQTITNLSGIEDFAALSVFHCRNQSITSLDLSNNKNLTELNCTSNQLHSLNITGCGLLTSIDVSDNKLTELNTFANTELVKLYCFINQITSLDLSKNPNLVTFGCSTNKLTSLNLKNENNTKLDIGFLRLEDNNLTCIQVDDKAYSDANWEGIVLKDVNVTFETVCTNLSVNDLVFENMTVSPNPTNGILNIDNVMIDQVDVYSLLGSKVRTYSFTNKALKNSIDLSDLTQGMYLVYIKSEGATVLRKIVVE